jgi:hypothetical protein
LRYKDKADCKGTEIDLAKAPLVLIPGDYIGWRMTNRGTTDFAVSLLYRRRFWRSCDLSRTGSGTDNLLTKNGGTHATKRAKITTNPIGNERVVLIAVPRLPEHRSPDFSFLEQETLPKARGNGDPDNAGLDSPLGRLLKNALYSEGNTRGIDSGDAAEAHLMLQSWRVTADRGQ